MPPTPDQLRPEVVAALTTPRPPPADLVDQVLDATDAERAAAAADLADRTRAFLEQAGVLRPSASVLDLHHDQVALLAAAYGLLSGWWAQPGYRGPSPGGPAQGRPRRRRRRDRSAAAAGRVPPPRGARALGVGLGVNLPPGRRGLCRPEGMEGVGATRSGIQRPACAQPHHRHLQMRPSEAREGPSEARRGPAAPGGGPEFLPEPRRVGLNSIVPLGRSANALWLLTGLSGTCT
jgi:hypothetical protein